MPIRLSGMVSGMDTETLVSALVSGYKVKKDNLVKAQTKLSWKQEKWKTMNTSIYSFYSGKLSAGRLSNAYSLKKSTVSNSTVATVTASSSAVAGTQSLKVKKLASSGYLTGGTVKDGKANITGSSKLSDITGSTSQGSVTLSVDGKSTNIELTEDMTVNQFVVKLKDAGVQASFDENNQRFFISSKTSGAKGDFTLVANDTDGMSSLNKLGLSTKIYDANNKDNQSATYKEYEKWAKYWNDYDSAASEDDQKNTELGKMIESAYESQEISFDTVANEKLAEYNSYENAMNSFDKKYAIDTANDTEKNDSVSYDSPLAKAEAMQAENQKKIDEFVDKCKNDNKDYFDENGNIDVNKITKEEDKVSYKQLIEARDIYKSDIDTYNKAKEEKDKLLAAGYVDKADDGKIIAVTKDSQNATFIQQDVDNRNTKIKTNIINQYTSKAKNSSDMLSAIQSGTGIYAQSAGAVRIDGQDAEIELNGAKFTSNTSTFSINGLTIQATAETKGDESVTITTDTDVDAIYKSIKDMFTEYNKLIKSMDEAYNADSSKGYEPLTDEEKDAMSDTEVEKWETKIKDSLLRKDDTLNSVANTLKNDMASSFIINGKSYALSSFGISTLGYFASGENEKGVYHIDGDKDDTTTSGNEDKLRAAIASDPETVVSFFSQLCTKVYTDLGNKMASSSVSSAYTIYNDKQMNTQYSEYNTKISDAESKVSTWEDYYYSKFSAMESALAKLNSQSSSMSGLFGS